MNITNQIFDELKNQTGKFRDVCLSDINGISEEKLALDQLLKLFLDIQEKAIKDKSFGNLTLVLILSYEYTKAINMAPAPKQQYETAHFYMVKPGAMFSEAAEEYRKSIALQNTHLSAISRSWRDHSSMQKRWEFCNALYVFDAVESQLS